MILSEFNPYLRYMDRHVRRFSYKTPILAYDFRLFYVLSGHMTAQVGAERHACGPSACLLILPGVPYQLFFDEADPAVLLVVNFDLDCRKTELPPLTPSAPEEFEPEKLIRPADPAPFADSFLLDSAPVLEQTLLTLLEEHVSARAYRDEMCSALLKSALLTALRLRAGIGRAPSELVRGLIDYLDAHFTEEITGSMLSLRFHYHAYYLGKRFREYTGQSIRQYQLALRMRRCAELLADTTLSVSEIASRVGFSSASYLSEYFRRTYGQTPTAYREASRIA